VCHEIICLPGNQVSWHKCHAHGRKRATALKCSSSELSLMCQWSQLQESSSSEPSLMHPWLARSEVIRLRRLRRARASPFRDASILRENRAYVMGFAAYANYSTRARCACTHAQCLYTHAYTHAAMHIHVCVCVCVCACVRASVCMLYAGAVICVQKRPLRPWPHIAVTTLGDACNQSGCVQRD